MTLLEDVAGGPKINLEFVDLIWSYERSLLLRIPILGTNDSLSEILSEAVRRHIHELAGEIGIRSRRARKQFQRDWPCHFHILRKNRRLIDEHVVPSLNRALISRTRPQPRCFATEGTTSGWRRIFRIVDITINRLGFRRYRAETAVPFQGTSLSTRMQVVLRLFRIRQRPIIFLTPFIGAHGEELHRLRRGEFVVYAFEHVVVPSEYHLIFVKNGSWPKINIADLSATARVSADRHQQTLSFSGRITAPVRLHAYVVS